MLTLLARVGMRAGEVASLALDDIDWRARQTTVSGKGSRRERLPLPADGGEAIAAYLQDRRPEPLQGARQVFLRVRAPHCGLTPGGVTKAVFSAGQRAGVGPIFAHRLRHVQALRAPPALARIFCRRWSRPASLSGHAGRYHRRADPADYGYIRVQQAGGLVGVNTFAGLSVSRASVETCLGLFASPRMSWRTSRLFASIRCAGPKPPGNAQLKRGTGSTCSSEFASQPARARSAGLFKKTFVMTADMKDADYQGLWCGPALIT
jgi:hypothetical protein